MSQTHSVVYLDLKTGNKLILEKAVNSAYAQFKYVQNVASSTWIIPHNTHSDKLIIEVKDTSGGKIVPDTIQITDLNTITVTFNQPVVGEALIVIFGWSPDPSVTPTPTVTTSNTASPTPTPTMTASVTSSATPTVTPTPTVTSTVTPTLTITPTLTQTSSVTPTVTATSSVTMTAQATVTPTVTLSPSLTLTPSVTSTSGSTATPTPTISTTPSITATTTATPTPTPSITVSTSQNAFPTDFDYAVLRMSWGANNGTDADMRVAITTPPRNIDVGWRRSNTDGTYLTWGGDNITPLGTEAVLINFSDLKTDYPDTNNIVIRLRNLWFSTRVDGNITWTFETYKGGTMQQSGTDFINVGGQSTGSKSILVNSTTVTQNNVDGDDTALLNFDLTSHVGEFVIEAPAVTVTPTISTTPSPTPTASVTPTHSLSPTLTPTITVSVTTTPNVTPTNTPTPSPTISITPSPTPVVSQTPSLTATLSITPTISITPSITPSVTPVGAIAFNGTNFATTQTFNGTPPTVSCAIPAGTQVGDYMVACVISRSAPTDTGTTSDFASVTAGWEPTAESYSVYTVADQYQGMKSYATVFRKKATSADLSALFTVTAKWQGTSTLNQRVGIVMLSMTTNTGDIILEHSAVSANTSTSNPSVSIFPSVASSGNGRMGVDFCVSTGTLNPNVITLSDSTWTLRSPQNVDPNNIIVATKILNTGDTTDLSATYSGGTVNSSNISLIFAPINSPYVTSTPTPTVSLTPTLSTTPSITPTLTKTISVTPSVTKSHTITPSVTKTKTPSPSLTPTITVTTTNFNGASYSAQVLADNPIAFYKLDDTVQNSVVDSSGNGRDLLATINVTLLQPPLLPDGGHSYNMNNGYAITNDLGTSFSGQDGVTYEAIINPTGLATAATNGMCIMHLGNFGVGNGQGIATYMQSDGRVGVQFLTQTLGYVVREAPAGTISASETALITITLDVINNQVNFYKNGSLVATNNISGAPDVGLGNSTQFAIGQFIGTGVTPNYTGNIDMVSMYRAVLSPSRILSHAQAAGFAALPTPTPSVTMTLTPTHTPAFSPLPAITPSVT